MVIPIFVLCEVLIMSIYCPLYKRNVVYLECLECETKECRDYKVSDESDSDNNPENPQKEKREGNPLL